MNGWQFADQYRQAEPSPVPIIAMTAARAGSAKAAAEIGAVQFLVKPFELDELLELVEYYNAGIRYPGK